MRISLSIKMLFFRWQWARYCLLSVSLAIPTFANAVPSISTAEAEGGIVQHGGRLTIVGAGFGAKADPAPVLVDYVSEAYEHGELNTAYSGFDDGQIIEPVSDQPSSRWAAATSILPVRYDTDSTPRHRFDVARYHLFGENVWLGRPVAYGGVSGWDTPTNNNQLYLSWWVKVDYNSLYYWRFKPYELSGSFKEGESVLSNGEYIGQYIGVDDEGLLNFVFPGHINVNNLSNVELVGQDSGSKTVFPDEFRAGDGYGFETPGTKTLRIWDDPNSQGIRTSLSHTDYFLASHSNSEYSSNRVYQRRDMKSNVWHHFEVELDIAKGTYKSWFNGNLGGIAQFDPRAAFEDAYSPTIALIGNNGKQDKLQNMYISEIYMDKSVQRVVIGDSSNYDDLTHYEIQRPLKWTNNEIEVSVNLGALDGAQDLFLYVFDKDGIPNSEGFSLCVDSDCPVPPQKIELKIN